jgi:hypothetical protein
VAWEDSELTYHDGVHRAKRGLRNAVRRSWLVLLPAVLLAPPVFLAMTRRVPVNEATVRFRVLQGWERANERNMDGFFRDSVLTSAVLKPVIDGNNLYASQRKRAMYLAIEEFREDLEVDAVRWEIPDEVRLSRRSLAVVTLGYTHRDHDVAERVVRELAEEVLRASTAQSKAQAVAASRGAALLRSSALAKPKRKLVSEQPETVQEAEEQARRTRDAIARRLQGVVGAELDQEEQSLDFELMDLAVKETGGPASRLVAAIVAAFVGLFGTVLVALLSNAGHDLVGDLDDLGDAGLRPLGKLSMPLGGSGSA